MENKLSSTIQLNTIKQTKKSLIRMWVDLAKIILTSDKTKHWLSSVKIRKIFSFL